MAPHRARLPRGWFSIVALCIGGVLAVLSGCTGGNEVETVRPRRGEIRESFVEPARTRLATTYRITMPVEGRIGRIDLEPGDVVKAGQKLATIDHVPLEAAVAEARAAVEELNAEITVKDDNRLEETGGIEAKAMVDATDEAIKAADEEVLAEKARADHAKKSLERKKLLAKRNVIAEEELDEAELLTATSLTELKKQQFYRAAMKAFRIAVNLGPRAIDQYLGKKSLERKMLVHRLEQAKARLARAEHELGLARVTSPIDGVVLERHEQGACPLPAGRLLLLLGNLDQLEVVADVLTQDALRLRKDSRVDLHPATGLDAIPGAVTRIEPAGFTKLSSLGVEQQRVRVHVALRGGHDALGVGYRLEARSVLQAPDQSVYVLKIVDGRLARQAVTLGLRSDLELEITDGLAEDDAIVARPDTAMKEGTRVKAAEPAPSP